MVSGTADFHVDGAVTRLGPGGIIVIPGGTMHHAVVVGDEEVVNLDVFTPARPEYAPLPGA